MAFFACIVQWGVLVLVNSTYSSPVVKEQPGYGFVAILTRPVEGSELAIVNSTHISLVGQEQLSNGFMAIPTC